MHSLSCNIPGSTGLGAAFNREMWAAHGTVISTEMRAFSNANWYRGRSRAHCFRISFSLSLSPIAPTHQINPTTRYPLQYGREGLAGAFYNLKLSTLPYLPGIAFIPTISGLAQYPPTDASLSNQPHLHKPSPPAYIGTSAFGQLVSCNSHAAHAAHPHARTHARTHTHTHTHPHPHPRNLTPGVHTQTQSHTAHARRVNIQMMRALLFNVKFDVAWTCVLLTLIDNKQWV